MHTTIAQSQLKKLLVHTKRVVGSRHRLPEFGALRLGAGAGNLVVQANDGELAINVVTQAQTLNVGTVVVPADDFKSVIDNLSGTVEISTPKDGFVTITDGAGTFELRTIPNPDESVFHASLFETDGTLVEVTQQQVSQLAKLAGCASRDAARPILTGVHFRPGVVETTDSYKLVMLDVAHSFEGLVPSRLFTIVGQAKPSTASVHVGKDSTVVQAVTKFGTVTWSVRNIVGKFPDVKQLLPLSHERAFTLQRKPTEAALKRLSAIQSRSTTSPVTAAFDGIEVSLSVGSGEVGEGALKVPAPRTGGAIEQAFIIAFNPNHWRAVLDAATEDVIEMEMRDNLKPAMFRTAGFTGLLMPVRL